MVIGTGPTNNSIVLTRDTHYILGQEANHLVRIIPGGKVRSPLFSVRARRILPETCQKRVSGLAAGVFSCGSLSCTTAAQEHAKLMRRCLVLSSTHSSSAERERLTTYRELGPQTTDHCNTIVPRHSLTPAWATTSSWTLRLCRKSR